MVESGMLTKGLSAHMAARLEGGAPCLKYYRTSYAIIDDLLPEDLANAIGSAFPDDAAGFTRLNSFRERKFTSNRFDVLPPILGEIALALQSSDVVAQVERIAGMSRLVPDPTSYAGGVSIMGEGDFLNPHIDNSHNGARTLYRRVNLLYYPNPGWEHGDGGELVLWNTKVTRPHRIPPLFNRLVLMVTDRTSWHSVAPVRQGPRRCVSSYYFSEHSPDGGDYYHVTSFTGRPGQRVRRAWAPFDNGLRGLARTRFRLGRASDRGYQGSKG